MLAWINLRSTVISIALGCHEIAYLGGTLEVLDAISVDVVVRSDGFSEFWADNQSRSIGRWSTGEQHDSSTSVWECGLSVSYYLTQSCSRLTSRRAVATPRATPVHLKGLLSCSTGQGSLWSPSRMFVNWNSHAWTGRRNLDAAGAGMG